MQDAKTNTRHHWEINARKSLFIFFFLFHMLVEGKRKKEAGAVSLSQSVQFEKPVLFARVAKEFALSKVDSERERANSMYRQKVAESESDRPSGSESSFTKRTLIP